MNAAFKFQPEGDMSRYLCRRDYRQVARFPFCLIVYANIFRRDIGSAPQQVAA